ncbi:hypothetical protein SPLC1_S203660 [Arthrospira platensis C1]|nr:hypothetical protein SPLC1_S203660 [Arthrospira platensis C1]
MGHQIFNHEKPVKTKLSGVYSLIDKLRLAYWLQISQADDN